MSENKSATPSAIATVIAIGLNILPSTPSNAIRGKYTNMIIPTEKAAAVPTFTQLSRITSKVPDFIWLGLFMLSNRDLLAINPVRMDSSITIEPSTKRPKSKAKVDKSVYDTNVHLDGGYGNAPDGVFCDT